MGFSKKLDFFKIATGGKFAVKCVSIDTHFTANLPPVAILKKFFIIVSNFSNVQSFLTFCQNNLTVRAKQTFL